jgi:predicted metal-dependent peptidase
VTPEEKLMEARLYVAEHAPYFMDAVLRLIPYPTEEIPTYAVSPNMVMVYNPKYVLSLSDRQNATRLWHEIQHVLRDSFERLVDIDPDINNLCSDLAINSSGLDGPWDFGPDGILPSQLGFPDGLTMEEYHELLPKAPQAVLNTRVSGKCGSGKCGGAAGNSPNPELELKIQEIGRSTADIRSIKEQTARNIINHSKSAGILPGGWKEWAEALLTPAKIQWGSKLHNIYRDSFEKLESGMDDYTFSPISKRTFMFPNGAIRPSMFSLAVEVGLVLDTSGSMDIDGEIRPALREARSVILQSGNEKLWLVQIDANLGCQPKRVSAQDLLKAEIHGRGGTDFRPAFSFVPTLKPRPRLLIYFTDGIGPAPAQAPKDMEVIWCLMGKQRQVPTTWGRVVEVES